MKDTRSTTFEIDGKKLKEALVSKGLKLYPTSVELGKAGSYLSAAISMGYMSASVAIMLEKFYGISRSEYEHVEPTPEPESEPVAEESEAPANTGVDYIALYNVIYAAVYAALKKNSEDVKDRLFKGGEAS